MSEKLQWHRAVSFASKRANRLQFVLLLLTYFLPQQHHRSVTVHHMDWLQQPINSVLFVPLFRHPLSAMPKKIIQKKSAGRYWPSPKRGKVRNLYKKPATNNNSKAMKKFAPVPYVRHGEPSTKNKTYRQRWGHSIPHFMRMREETLIRTLIKENILQDWSGKLCPHCGEGKLGELTKHSSRHAWSYRCSRKKCQNFFQPHDFTHLNIQVCALFSAVASSTSPLSASSQI